VCGRLAKKPFVVFEKNHKLFAPPVNTSAESKIVESCRLVKAINPNVTCLMCEFSPFLIFRSRKCAVLAEACALAAFLVGFSAA
jgi:hypothetical protein